jgi:hypothetical protein
VEGGEEGSDGAEARGTWKIFRHKDGTYVNIPTMESLGPRLEWAQIRSQHLRSICGYWTRPIWGLKLNPRFHDKLWSELADHGGFPTVFRQLPSQA